MRNLSFLGILCLSLLIISACDDDTVIKNPILLQRPFEPIEILIGTPISISENDFLGHLEGTVKEISLETDTPTLVKITKRFGLFDIEGLKNGTPSLYLLINKKQKFSLTARLKTLPIKQIKPIELEIDLQSETIIPTHLLKNYFENPLTIKKIKIENPNQQDSLEIITEADQFRFKSTRKISYTQNLNLTINDTLSTSLSLGSNYNLFPAKVGDIWTFDYKQDYTNVYTNTTGGKSGIAIWRFTGVSSNAFTISEELTGILTINGVSSSLLSKRIITLNITGNNLNINPVDSRSNEWLVPFRSPNLTITARYYFGSSFGSQDNIVVLNQTGLVSIKYSGGTSYIRK